ncbi:hypothetical protein CANCADRAFT_22594 [Tortispora caseinolytica NRRL Y-17796]|uniref:ER membrane protein complex subunit 4 n=1 Tax=Tortispora caseinolytica NRRL Y-17796 TaxID=767744 RepID=A0A1E4TLB6_9ASCO|nr:hypothetical protein CANCADRAFT_22594 [Tortispora caseinolytica NRRL Y-17796]
MTELPRWYYEQTTTTSSQLKDTNIQNPPGFDSNITKTVSDEPSRKDIKTQEELKVSKAWSIVTSSAKMIPMNAIIAYFAGNSLQMFSILTTFMLFWTPIKALTSINATFAPYSTEATQDKILVTKLAYMLLQLVQIGIGIWKIDALGLLPTHKSDWLAWEPATSYMERTVR